MANSGNTHYDQAGAGATNAYNVLLNTSGTALFLGTPFALDKAFGMQNITDGSSISAADAAVRSAGRRGAAHFPSSVRNGEAGKPAPL
jgi:hypothetical protein